MKTFVCIVLLAAAAAAAPEGKRDKRGYLSSHASYGSYELPSYHSYEPLSHSYEPISHGYEHLSHGYELGHSSLPLSYDHSYIAPSHHAKIVSINKVVQVPKVVEYKKVVSVPKVISVPQVIKVNKIVHEPTLTLSSHNSGWW